MAFLDWQCNIQLECWIGLMYQEQAVFNGPFVIPLCAPTQCCAEFIVSRDRILAHPKVCLLLKFKT